MIKVKEFYSFGTHGLDDQINEFLANGNRTYVDVTYQFLIDTERFSVALLVYREDKK